MRGIKARRIRKAVYDRAKHLLDKPYRYRVYLTNKDGSITADDLRHEYQTRKSICAKC